MRFLPLALAMMAALITTTVAVPIATGKRQPKKKPPKKNQKKNYHRAKLTILQIPNQLPVLLEAPLQMLQTPTAYSKW